MRRSKRRQTACDQTVRGVLGRSVLLVGTVVLLSIVAVVDAHAQPESGQPSVAPLVCTSSAGQRQHCAADTSSGVVLLKSADPAACLLGKTWGYDNNGVWVTDGCSGEFLLGAAAQAAAQTAPVSGATVPEIETWGEFDPGRGFLVGRSSAGELSISAYGLLRYINQTPGEQDFTDHLGNTRPVDGRHDIYPHRVMIFFKGWLGNPKLIYALTFWTVLDTSQNAIFANLGYQFSRKFSVYGGLNGNPGTRSLQGSHPFWLGHDRVMADEFFRPFFGSGVWVQGEACSWPLVQRDAGQQQQHPRRQVEPARSKVHHRRVGVVDAHDERVRAQGRLQRLGDAREGGHPIRRLVDAQPRAAVHRRQHGHSRKHDPQAGGQRERVRDRRAGAGRHRGHGGLPGPLDSMPA